MARSEEEEEEEGKHTEKIKSIATAYSAHPLVPVPLASHMASCGRRHMLNGPLASGGGATAALQQAGARDEGMAGEVQCGKKRDRRSSFLSVFESAGF